MGRNVPRKAGAEHTPANSALPDPGKRRGMEWDLIRAMLGWQPVHWLQGFVIFRTWRSGRQQKAYVEQFGVQVSKANHALKNILMIEGARIERMAVPEGTWQLRVESAAARPASFLKAVTHITNATRAFRYGDPQGWAELWSAHKEWPQQQRLCHIALLAPPAAISSELFETVASVSVALEGYKEALLGAMIKVSLLAREGRQDVDECIASPALEGWIGELAAVSEALAMLQQNAPSPRCAPRDSVAEFASLARQYRDLSASIEVGRDTDDPANEVDARDRNRFFERICALEFVTRVEESLADESEDAHPRRITTEDISECRGAAVHRFLQGFSPLVQEPGHIEAVLRKCFRVEVERSRTTKHLFDELPDRAETLTAVEERLLALLKPFESVSRLRPLITRTRKTIPDLRFDLPAKCADVMLNRSASKAHVPTSMDLFPEVFTKQRVFGGREDEIRQLNRFLEETQQGYFFVTGPSGFGKTALLAALAQDLKHRRIPVAAHFITRQRPEDPKRFCLKNLGRQLASLHRMIDDPPSDDWDLPSYYRDLLLKQPAKGRRIVVILDGLDEAMPTWLPDRVVFPPDLPRGVHVVFSAREIADKDWLEALGLALPADHVLCLCRLSADGVRDVVCRSNLFSGDDEWLEQAIERLWILSEGDPFYLHDLMLELERSRGDIESLSEYQIGFNNYLAQWWKDGCQTLGGQASGSRTFGGLMALLAVARAPIGRDMLIALGSPDGLAAGNYRSIMEHAAPFAVGDRREGYALSHTRITDFIEHEMQHELDEYKSRFADYACRWNDLPPGPGRDYALRFGPGHLAAAGRHDDIRTLLFDFRWLQAKLDVTDVNALLADFDFLKEDEARQIRDAIRLSAHALAKDPRQLAGQLLGRLADVRGKRTGDLLRGATAYRARPWIRPVRVRLISPGGPLVRTLEGHARAVKAVATTDRGNRIVSVAQNHELRVWDTVSGACLRTVLGIHWRTDFVTVLPDGNYALSQTYHVPYPWGHPVLSLISLNDGAIVREVYRCVRKVDYCLDPAIIAKARLPTEQVLSFVDAAVTPDGRLALAATTTPGNELIVLDLETGTVIHVLKGHSELIKVVRATVDSRFAVTASDDNTLGVWDLEAGRRMHTIHHSWPRLWAMALTGNGRFGVFGTESGTLILWDMRAMREVRTLTGHNGAVTSVATTPCSRFAISASMDCTLRVWDLENGHTCGTLRGHTSSVQSVAVLPDGCRVVSGSEDKTLRIWDLRRLASAEPPVEDSHRITTAAFCGDPGDIISIAYGGRLEIRDGETGTLEGSLESVIGLSADGSYAAVTRADGSAEITHVGNRRCLCEIPAEEDEYEGVGIAPSMRYVAAVHGRSKIDVWDLHRGERAHRIEHEGRAVSAVVFSPDDRFAVSVTYAHMQGDPGIVWDVEMGQKLSALVGHDLTGDIWDAAITPDGGRLVTAGGDGKIRLWCLPDGRELLALNAHDGWVKAVAVTPDGRHIVSVSYDRSLRVWNMANGRLVASFTTDSELGACAVDQDGRRIAVGDTAGQMHLFHVEGVE